MSSKWYKFSQNNSGGHFDVDEDLSHMVFVEAEDAEHANFRFKAIGGYFDGCESGIDCDCCGDRWYEVEDDDDLNLEGKTIEEYVIEKHVNGRWNLFKDEYTIHFLDQSKKRYKGIKK